MNGDRKTASARVVSRESLAVNLKFTLRSLYRDKSFVLTATSILALGIGVNLAFLATLEANLSRRPPHVVQPDAIFQLSFEETSLGARAWGRRASYRLFQYLKDVLRDAAIVAGERRSSVGFGGSEVSREVDATLVTQDYFDLLGVQPLRGRAFSGEEHDWAAGQPVAVLDYDFWKALPDSKVAGALEIWVGDRGHQVIGVLPQGFRGISPGPSPVWLPLESADLADPFNRSAFELLTNPETRVLDRVLVRPLEGQSPDRIRSILEGALVGADLPWSREEFFQVHLGVVKSSPLGPFSENMVRWGSLMAILTLLAACANVATLALFRGLQRSEITLVQSQLGATPRRLFFETLTGSLVLSVVATCLSLGLVWAIVAVLQERLQLPPLSAWELFTLKGTTLLTAVVLGVACATAIPAGLQAMRMGLPIHPTRPPLSFPRAGRMRTFLLFLQVAAATCLLCQMELFRASVDLVLDRLGFAPSNLLLVEVPNLRKLGQSETSIRELFDRMETKARSLPGVLATGRANSAPFRNFLVTQVLGPDGKRPKTSEGVTLTGVSPGFMGTMGMTLLHGRHFGEEDSSGSESVAILNRRLAHLLLEEENPLGDCVYIGRRKKCTRVVGIVENSFQSRVLGAAPEPQCFVPLTQYGETRFGHAGDYLLVRVDEGQALQVGRRLKEASEEFPYYIRVEEVDAAVREQVHAINVGLAILGLLGLVGVAVAAVGIFAQLAFWVGSRRQELGVRLALGAPSSRILRTVASRAATPVGAGLAFGLASSIPLSRLARSYVFGLTALTVDSMLLITLIVLLAGILACALPCVRALKLDPIEALRTL